MLSEMSHAEFDEWCAKDLIEPIGNRGTHEILVRLCCMIATYIGQEGVKKNAFAPWMIEPEEEPVSDEVAIAALMMAGARLS